MSLNRGVSVALKDIEVVPFLSYILRTPKEKKTARSIGCLSQLMIIESIFVIIWVCEFNSIVIHVNSRQNKSTYNIDAYKNRMTKSYLVFSAGTCKN